LQQTKLYGITGARIGRSLLPWRAMPQGALEGLTLSTADRLLRTGPCATLYREVSAQPQLQVTKQL